MVIADGIVHPQEMETLYRIGTETYGLSEEEIDLSVKDSGVSNYIPETYEERICVLYEMALIAWADGKIEDTERILLKRYASLYGVADESIEELVDFLLERAKNNSNEQDVITELSK